MEGSYREYHKGAYSAALIHPTEAEQEAQRTRVAICSLLGLRPPSESDEQSLSESVKESVKHGTEGGEEAEDGAEAGEGEDGKEGERVGEETEGKEVRCSAVLLDVGESVALWIGYCYAMFSLEGVIGEEEESKEVRHMLN